MKLPIALVAIFVMAALAGCAEKTTKAPVEEEPDTQFTSGVLNLSSAKMPRAPRVGGEINLTHAPAWRLGEWWTYKMVDNFTGATFEFTRVVAGEDRLAGNYLVGFPAQEFSNDVMIFHVPGFGDITQADLSYETHDSYFRPLKFPLMEAESWEISFEGQRPGTAVVAEVDGNIAIIETDIMSGMKITYDAEIGEVSLLEIPGYATVTVTGHGYDYKGLVRVPHAHDLLFNHGRLAGAVAFGSSGATAKAPSETVVVTGGYDRISFIMAVGAGPFLGGAPAIGYFQETVTAPDQKKYSVSWSPADIPTHGMLKIVAVGHDLPEGTWIFDHLAVGVGIAFVEGIGYHSIDVDLPSGCVVASANAAHHIAPCKTTRQDAGEGSYDNTTP